MKFSDLGEIAVAWYRFANPTPEQQDIAQERLNICESCESHVYVSTRRGYKCDVCGCPTHKKIFSPKPGPNACPKAKWSR